MPPPTAVCGLQHQALVALHCLAMPLLPLCYLKDEREESGWAWHHTLIPLIQSGGFKPRFKQYVVHSNLTCIVLMGLRVDALTHPFSTFEAQGSNLARWWRAIGALSQRTPAVVGDGCDVHGAQFSLSLSLLPFF